MPYRVCGEEGDIVGISIVRVYVWLSQYSAAVTKCLVLQLTMSRNVFGS